MISFKGATMHVAVGVWQMRVSLSRCDVKLIFCDITSQGSHRLLLERAIINFQALGDRKIHQEHHTVACFNKRAIINFKLLLIEQIIGEIG